jgi:hypothetical protein
MTIIATQFSLVLGAWRVRLRFDIDEPREVGVREPSGAPEAGVGMNGSCSHRTPTPASNSSAPTANGIWRN